MNKTVYRIMGLITGIILAGAAAGACIGFFTNSWDILSPDNSRENPLYIALSLGFALSAGLAVYSLFGWIQSQNFRKQQNLGFDEIKDLIDQERESFKTLTRIWDQKELAWQGEKHKWNNKRESWFQEREKWETQKSTILKELGKKRQDISMWAEKEKLWEDEKKRLKELWEQAQKVWSEEKKEFTRNRIENSSQTETIAEKNNLLKTKNEKLKTENKDLEDKLRILSDQLEKACKEKLTFLTKISGALKSPVGQIIQLSRSSAKDSKEVFTEIKHLAENFLAKLENVLDLARLQTGSYNLVVSETNLEKVLSRIASDLEPVAASRDITFIWNQAGDDLGRISVDERLIERCIRSLVDNAIKFTERAGRIELKGNVVYEKNKPLATIEVKDTGIGIAPKDHDNIFEPFVHDIQQRNELSPEGVGMGLSLVKGFLNIHGGDISVKSNTGEGSTFKLSFFERETDTVKA